MRVMQAGLGPFAPPELRSRAAAARVLPAQDSDRAYQLLRVLAGVVWSADPGKLAARALEQLVLVVCRWAWAADSLMQPAIRVAREVCAETRCLTLVLKGWRQVVARGGHARAAELRVLHRSWAAGTWATLPAIQLANRHAWASPRAQQWHSTAEDPRVRYRGMLLLPSALPRWRGVFGALREVWLEDVPVPTC